MNELPLKIVITGASGTIGRQLIQEIRHRNIQLLLVGRDVDKIRDLEADGIIIADYENWSSFAKEYDAVIHLATRNNNQDGSLEDFREANVGLLDKILQSMRAAKIQNLINFSSLNALNQSLKDPYSKTKREADSWLRAQEGINILNIRLPAVYGDRFTGKLALLNKVPRLLRPLILDALKCLRPAVSISIVTEKLMDSIENPVDGYREIIVTDKQERNGLYHLFTWGIDMAFSIFVVVFLWWLLAIVWVAVKFTSPGPGLIAQRRVGRMGNEFTCYKFRTMYEGTKQTGTHEVPTSSITSVGRFIRKTKIDELPQIINIFKNEMSLVGPRPSLTIQADVISEREKRRALDIKPGLTGLAQIQNIDMSTPKMLAKTDADYISLRTVILNIKIIFKTILRS